MFATKVGIVQTSNDMYGSKRPSGPDWNPITERDHKYTVINRKRSLSSDSQPPIIIFFTASTAQSRIMPSFLEIPRELRDKIIELAIMTEAAPPQNADVGNAAVYKELNDIHYLSWNGANFVLYRQNSIPSNTLSLLLVSRSVQAQTLAALARLQCTSTFKLDVMLVQECQLWATWTSYHPVFTPEVETVHVSFRILPRTKCCHSEHSNHFRGSDGGPLTIIWQLHSLLERSLRCGPATIPVKREKGFKVIRSLDLDVITPANSSAEQRQIEQDGGIFRVLAPERWVSIIQDGIERLLNMKREAFQMGRILYERVGKIRIMWDGEVQAEYDLAKLLSGMRYSPQEDERYPKSSAVWWKRVVNVYGKRVAAGLPCNLEPWNMKD